MVGIWASVIRWTCGLPCKDPASNTRMVWHPLCCRHVRDCCNLRNAPRMSRSSPGLDGRPQSGLATVSVTMRNSEPPAASTTPRAWPWQSGVAATPLGNLHSRAAYSPSWPASGRPDTPAISGVGRRTPRPAVHPSTDVSTLCRWKQDCGMEIPTWTITLHGKIDRGGQVSGIRTGNRGFDVSRYLEWRFGPNPSRAWPRVPR